MGSWSDWTESLFGELLSFGMKTRGAEDERFSSRLKKWKNSKGYLDGKGYLDWIAESQINVPISGNIYL